MSIVILGVTECVVCGQAVEEGEGFLSFSAFISNDLDKLARFNDSAVHLRCLEDDPASQEATRWSEMFKHENQVPNRICRACDLRIIDWRDHIGIGLLTSDRSDSVAMLNFLQLHRSHIHSWARTFETIEQLRQAIDEAHIGGPAVEKFVSDLSSLAW